MAATEAATRPVLRVAAIQMASSAVKADNLERAERLISTASSRGADVVVLPERWNALGGAGVLNANAEAVDDGETVEAMSRWARDHGTVLIGGSITERPPTGDRLANTCLVFSPSGEIVARYRKLHPFDVDVGGRRYRESDSDEPGNEIVSCDVSGWRIGLSICYDLRFPELYRIHALQGCSLVSVPADFTLHTGRDHWELLLRARAVENQYYVVAAGQWGRRPDGCEAFGRSMVVDPWGIVLAQAADEDCVITADIDVAVLRRVRAAIPCLDNRRADTYELKVLTPAHVNDDRHRSEAGVELTDANV